MSKLTNCLILMIRISDPIRMHFSLIPDNTTHLQPDRTGNFRPIHGVQLERGRIIDFVSETDATPVRLSAAERIQLVQCLKDRLNVDVETRMPWAAVDAPQGVHTVSGWKFLPMFVAATPCLAFSACATSIWKFANGAELLLFLEASPAFEFYVCDALATYLLCCNEHDFIIGWGRSVEWVRKLKPVN